MQLSHIFRKKLVQIIQHSMQDKISDRVVEQIIDVLIPEIRDRVDEVVTVMHKQFDGRKLDAFDLGDEDEKNMLEELKVIIVTGGDAEYVELS